MKYFILPLLLLWLVPLALSQHAFPAFDLRIKITMAKKGDSLLKFDASPIAGLLIFGRSHWMKIN